jgi:predicted dehydrogenase
VADAVSRTTPLTSPLSVGFIGATSSVRESHLPVLLTSNGVKVAWVADGDVSRADAAAAAFGIATHALADDLSTLPAADVYLLAGSGTETRRILDVLRERDAAVYVEAPLTGSLSQHQEFCTWFPDFKLASGAVTRSWGPVVETRRVIESQMFGELVCIRVGYGYAAMPVTSDRRLVASAVDSIDAVLFAAEACSVQVEEVRRQAGDKDDLSIEANLRVETESGRPVRCELTLSRLRNTIEGVEFEFEHATLSYPMPGQGYALLAEEVDRVPLIKPRRGGPPYHLMPLTGRYFPMTNLQIYHAHWAEFLNGLQQGRANRTSAVSAIPTAQVIDALDGKPRHEVPA